MMAAIGYYVGAIDGDAGPKTWAGIHILERQYSVEGWTNSRRVIGALQSLLNSRGHHAGDIDGYAGNNTHEAITEYWSSVSGVSSKVEREPLAVGVGSSKVPLQSDAQSVYGRPGDESRMAVFLLPFQNRLDYALDTRTRKLRLNKLVGSSAVDALTEAHDHYGDAEYRRLGLDRYAGGYVNRPMRGSNSTPSMHAHGIAMDFYASKNRLRWRCPRALFCAEEYRPFLDIMESHGWLSALRMWGGDAMHFQKARLR